MVWLASVAWNFNTSWKSQSVAFYADRYRTYFFAFGTEIKWPLTALDRVTLCNGSIYREVHPSDLRVTTLDTGSRYNQVAVKAGLTVIKICMHFIQANLGYISKIILFNNHLLVTHIAGNGLMVNTLCRLCNCPSQETAVVTLCLSCNCPSQETAVVTLCLSWPTSWARLDLPWPWTQVTVLAWRLLTWQPTTFGTANVTTPSSWVQQWLYYDDHVYDSRNFSFSVIFCLVLATWVFDFNLFLDEIKFLQCVFSIIFF